MIEPDSTSLTGGDVSGGGPPQLDAAAVRRHPELVRTWGEVRVDDDLGMGDNAH